MHRIDGIASELGLSKRQVSKLISEGVFPCYRVGRTVFLDLEEVYSAIRLYGDRQPVTLAQQHEMEEEVDE